MRDGLWAQVALCQKLVTAATDSTGQQQVRLSTSPPTLVLVRPLTLTSLLT